MSEPYANRPDTGQWSDDDMDAYTAGRATGEAARDRAALPPSPEPSDSWEWGFHDGYHRIDTTNGPYRRLTCGDCGGSGNAPDRAPGEVLACVTCGGEGTVPEDDNESR